MPTPVYTPGQVLGAADCNNWFMPKVAYKAADTTRASTVTPANDPDLTIPVVVNAFYAFQCYLFFEGSATVSQGLKINWVVSTGTTLRYHAIFTDASNNQSTGVSYTATGTPTGGTNGAGSLRGMTMHGSLFTGSTAGSLTLQWSQNVNEAATVTLHAQSYMMLSRMG